MPRPEDGKIANGIYTNEYFDLSYPAPPGWTQGLAGPDPSESGYYVLATLIPAGTLSGTVLIAAQDQFFAATAPGDAMETARAFATAVSALPGVTVDHQPAEALIGGRVFSRVDFHGVGLYRSTFFVHLRCHVVSFNLTANSRELREALVQSLNDIGTLSGGAAAGREPVCIRGYAGTHSPVTKVDPATIGPRFAPIPVRIVVGAEGAVTQVHVIRATGEQRNSIENALGRWTFKPHEIDGRPTVIETGLLVRFTAAGGVSYSDGGGPPPEARAE
jgi:hypothetical protein